MVVPTDPAYLAKCRGCQKGPEMDINEYRKRIGEYADKIASAERSADSASTLDLAATMADMYQSDGWLELAAELVPLPKSTGSPYKRRERTRARFARFNTVLTLHDGHSMLPGANTARMLKAADTLPFLEKTGQAQYFATARSVRPLETLVTAGLGERIPEVIALAQSDGAPLTATTLRDAAAVVKKKATAGSRGQTYKPGADERTESAEYRAEQAFLKLLEVARKSDNGVAQLNKYIQFIKDETRKYRREDAA